MAVPKVFIRSPYNYDMMAASDEAAMVDNGEPSPTVQSEKDNTDINIIVKRFGLTGTVPMGHRTPEYGDFSGISDYQSALNAVRAAGEAFMELPADLRARFQNDPQRYHDFVLNPENGEELVKLGLANRRELSDNKDVPRGTSNDGDDDGKASVRGGIGSRKAKSQTASGDARGDGGGDQDRDEGGS